MINESLIKVVATIGPRTANKDSLLKMQKAGMSIARLNGSHNNIEWHKNTIALIKSVTPSIPILLDIPGKKIRTAQLNHEPSFNILDEIILTTTPGYDGKKKVSVNNPFLHKSLSNGDVILADDGTIKFEVIKIIKKDIYCRAMTKGTLKSAKGINVPHVSIKSKLITDKDRFMMKFAEKNKVDFVGISFVESKKHINSIRKLSSSSWPRIVAKVENQGGMDNLDEIINEADAIMIDRGDLSTETNLESIAIFQKRIISKAKNYGKPVIVATEMLHTMIDNSFPTKAEVVDISNAIIDGASATMLSGETAIGNFPIESIKMMSNISKVVLKNINNNIIKKPVNEMNSIPKSIGASISQLCLSLPISKIICVTISGYSARLLSSQILSQPIIAVSNDKIAAKSFNLLRNTKGIYIDLDFRKDSLDHVLKCIKYLWKNKEISTKDVILVTGVGYPKSGRRMNMIQTHYVKDLKELFNW